jgi:hypothetical protein
VSSWLVDEFPYSLYETYFLFTDNFRFCVIFSGQNFGYFDQ